MGKARQLSQCVRSNILLLHREGYSLSEISSRLNVSRSAASRLLKLQRETGSTLVRKRKGRPTKIDLHTQRRMKWRLEADPFCSVRKLQQDIPELAGVSLRTIREVAQKKLSMRAVKAVSKPLLTKLQIRKRLAFCKRVKNWTTADWEKVLWSDESSFALFQNARQYVRRRRGANPHDPKYTKAAVKHPASVMVWGCFSSAGTGGLHFVPQKETLNANRYKAVLQQHLLPSIQASGCTIFMQDGAPCHTAKQVTKWISDQGIQLLQWPPNSPDLNPIENLWGYMKQSPSFASLSTRQQLTHEISRVWNNEITLEQCRKLVHSMPHRVSSVLRNGGYACKY